MSGIRTPGRRADPGPGRPHAGRGARPLAAAQDARRLRRPGARQGAARHLHRGRQGRATRRSTTSCSPARPGSARPRSRRSSPTSWAPGSWPPPARRSSARATWPATSPRSSRAASSSSTRSTGSRARSRRPSIPPWRTASCRSRWGRAPGAAVVSLDLPAFTLIGATTRTGLLTTPLRDRFGVTHRLELYEPADLARIVQRSAGILDVDIDTDGAEAIAGRSRGTPRVANRLLKRVRDFAEVRGTGRIDAGVAAEALDLLEVDAAGLDRLDREILRAICVKFGGGPVGPQHARGGGGRGAGHDRGRLRAVSAPAGLPDAHPARAHRDRRGLRPSRPGTASWRRAAPLLT